MDCNQATTDTPRWLFFWAMLTVCAAFPLLFLGAEVTTKGVGMVDPRGLRTPWVFVQGVLEDRGLGWLIEHGHRLAGWTVGACVIVLAAGLGLCERRRWVRILGLTALLGVILQGVLGIFRIELNEIMGRTLAWVHGCFAQLVFALLVSVAVVSSRWWKRLGNREDSASDGAAPVSLRGWSLLTAILIYLQLVLGGLVRHMDLALAARGHLLLAFAVVAAVLWLAHLALSSEQRDRRGAPVKLLLVLVSLQVLLGVETWLSKFFTPAAPWTQLQPLAVHHELFRSLHYVLGAGIFATAITIALVAHRHAAWNVKPALAPEKRLEGVL